MAGLPVSRQRLSMELQRNEVMEDSWCDFGECVSSEIESFSFFLGKELNIMAAIMVGAWLLVFPM